MKVSFLVTFYNQKEFVQQALDSILAIRKPFDWEICVGDDGSNDGTVDEVKAYLERYPDNIFLHVMPRDISKKYDSVERVSMNRLSILEKATGDYFCFLDGDDYYCDHDFVNEALEVLCKNTAISMVMYGHRYFGETAADDEVILPQKYNYRCIEKEKYLRAFYVHAGACVYRKYNDCARMELIKKLRYYDDNDIVINNLYYGDAFVICRAVYAYRQTGNSIYTGMQQTEQAVLNVLGYDVDVRLVEDKYREDIKTRYRGAIITMFLRRKELKEKLDAEKYGRYTNRSAAIENALAYKLLTWQRVMPKEKRKVVRFILPLLVCNARFTVKIMLDHITS